MRQIYPPTPTTKNKQYMYSTEGIEAVATITELRSGTAEIIEHAKQANHGVMIQKNNEPYAVLISYDRYRALLDLEAGSKKSRKK